MTDRDPNPDNLAVGDTYTATAMNGHLMDYTVRAIGPDGVPIASQWNAVHSDDCPCYDTPEREPLPDW